MKDIDKVKTVARLFWIYLSLVVVVGVAGHEMEHLRDALNISATLIGSFLIFLWVHYDSKSVGKLLSPPFKVGVVGLPIVFVPIYIFITRGVAKGFVVILVFALKVIGFYALIGLLLTGLQMADLYRLPA
ncbi:hypothetical protein [Methylomonas rhizoryzae]|uniref:hypothetical protein n=1 Tax=Methylomonas rhizoryzae TaxID=2608981 RepID=UPI00123190C1|nr:hypothetical protein [Methylomonas rhizoryzae]